MSSDKNTQRPYSIEPYSPEWPALFSTIRDKVKSVFGPKASTIEHVGSTAVPGMHAKRCIDVMVIVSDIHDLVSEGAAMQQLGYERKDNYINPDTIMFDKADVDGRKVENIHVCLPGSFNEHQFLVGRDYLRTHPERAQMYNELKAELNKKYPDDYISYRNAKQDFLKETKRLAEEWARQQETKRK